MRTKILFFMAALGLYLFSAGLTFAALSYFYQSSERSVFLSPLPDEKTNESGFKIDPSAPKTEECLLNGGMFTKKEREIWEKRRPLGVMIENHFASRPQSGLAKADVVYEVVAEGGITRFLAIFYCHSAEEIIVGPVRSARTYFLDFISEYGDKPLYAHVGGANTPGPADALGQINKYGWVGKNDLNQFSIGFPYFWRDYERLGYPVATEHTMYSTTSKLWKVAADRGLTNVDKDNNFWDEDFEKWKFIDDINLSERPSSSSAEFNFWSGYGDYLVHWEYNKQTNSYQRLNGGKNHLDKNNNNQITAKNVVLAFQKESFANDDYENGRVHLLYKTIGEGKAKIFQNGKIIDGTWKKISREKRTKFYDQSGREISFVRGPIWIEILPTGTAVKYN